MTNFAFFLAVTVAGIVALCSEGDNDAVPPKPVVVELFTSEGCSSCPPADQLLADIATESPVKGVQIIPLALHVDYWNNLGWNDPFASAAFADRQTDYQISLHTRSLYTPQVVVNGAAECVGSDRAEVKRLIESASKLQPLGLDVTSKQLDEVQIQIDTAPLAPSMRLMLAVTEDGLSSKVQRGENAGRRLDHAAVVRLLKPVEAPGPGKPIVTSVKLDPNWKRGQLHVVAFVQSDRDHSIRAAATMRLPAVR